MHLTRAQTRQLDRRAIEEFGMPGILLMENAGRSAAEVLIQLGVQGKVVVCSGKGNNGGDGFVMARHVDLHRHAVEVLLFANANDLSADAAIHFAIAERAKIPIPQFSSPSFSNLDAVLNQAEWIVDALYGTGLEGPVRPPLDQVILAMNRSGRKILAIDIPSGLNCDTGEPMGPTVRATHTVTLVAEKAGFANASAKPFLGQVHVASIGAPRQLLDSIFNQS